MVSASTGDAGRAARLFGAAEALREASSIALILPLLDRAAGVAAARSKLGDAQSAAALAEGRAMTLEQAIEYALAAN